MKQLNTKLSVTISTDYTHEAGDTLEIVRQQVEVLTFHLQSVFSFIKRSAFILESEIDAIPVANGFCFDLINFSDIGEGLVQTIREAISELTELQKPLPPNEIEAVKPAQTIAEQLSALLNNADVPAPISEAIKDALNDFYNKHIDQTEFKDEQDSAAYIRRMLENSEYFKIGGEVNDEE